MLRWNAFCWKFFISLCGAKTKTTGRYRIFHSHDGFSWKLLNKSSEESFIHRRVCINQTGLLNVSANFFCLLNVWKHSSFRECIGIAFDCWNIYEEAFPCVETWRLCSLLQWILHCRSFKFQFAEIKPEMDDCGDCGGCGDCGDCNCDCNDACCDCFGSSPIDAAPGTDEPCCSSLDSWVIRICLLIKYYLITLIAVVSTLAVTVAVTAGVSAAVRRRKKCEESSLS